MLSTLSLRSRLTALLCIAVCAALVPCGLAWIAFSQAQVTDEQEVGRQIAEQLGETFNRALGNSSAPQHLIEAFALKSPNLAPGMLGVVQADDIARLPKAPPVSSERVPNWFGRMIASTESVERFPLLVDGKPAAYLVYVSESALDVYEKWIAFLGIMAFAIGLVALCSILAYWTVGVALRPLELLAANLKRMRDGFYDVQMACDGPPELRESCSSANELSARLQHLSGENRKLLRRIIVVQDDERSDLSRELHDEVGPILFAIRAGVSSLSSDGPQGPSDGSLDRLTEAVEMLQRANRRVLERLRPMHLEQLGLRHSIQDIVKNVQAQRPELGVTCTLASELDALDPVLARTIYRVIQEATTNVLRHTEARTIAIQSGVVGETVSVAVVDDGVLPPQGFVFGRGLTGMQERVRALGGELTITRHDDRTILSCRLPVAIQVAGSPTLAA